MDQDHFVGMVLADIQNAFDTVDHCISLMELGVKMWSYLSFCQQLVDDLELYPHMQIVRVMFPLGSILGPLLFLIYVNDMSEAVSNKLLLYADDSMCI